MITKKDIQACLSAPVTLFDWHCNASESVTETFGCLALGEEICMPIVQEPFLNG